MEGPTGRTALVAIAIAVLVGWGIGAGGVPGGPAGTAAADPPDDARLAVTDVAVSPATPVTGEPVTMSVTLRNSGGSPSPVAVDWVAVRAGNETLANATDPGTLSQGETLTLPLTARFGSPGQRNLTVVAVGTDEDGNRTRVRRPLTVVIERAPPQLELDLSAAVVGERTRIPVTVANPTGGQVRNLVITVAGEGLEAVVDRRTVPDLAAGETATVNLSVRPTAAGDRPVGVTLSYTTATGVRAETDLSGSLSVAPTDRDVGVRVDPVDPDEDDSPVGNVQGVLGGGGGATEQDDRGRRPTSVSVTVSNFGNVPARSVVVTPVVGDRRLPRQAVAGPIAPGESASVTVDLSGVEARGTVRFAATYRMAGATGSANATYDYRPADGRVRLTGIGLRYGEDGTLLVEGNAGNVGDAEVQGVVVAVGNASGVSAAYPRRSYFVGAVEGSEFAPFELAAEVDHRNVTAVPLVVTYTVDGVERTRRVEVPFDDSLTPPSEGESDGFLDRRLLAGVGLGIALVALAVGLVVGVRRIRRSGGDGRTTVAERGGDD